MALGLAGAIFQTTLRNELASPDIVGVTLGVTAGYFGKWVDAVIMRIADMQLAFPGILLALFVLYALGPSVPLVITVLAINGWMIYARVARSLVLTLRSSDFVEAAELSGARPRRATVGHRLCQRALAGDRHP